MTSVSAICTWLNSNHSSCVEAIGFLTGVLNVWLVTRQSIWNWPIGLINATMYMVVFARTGLYSDTGLQAMYFSLSAYGWWHWWRGGVTRNSLPVTHVSSSLTAILAVTATAIWLLLWLVTSRIPGVALPHFDAALVAISLVAQWMMTRKIAEHWLLWIGVDIVYVGLFINRNLPLTALLYGVFLLLAIYGHMSWRRSKSITGMSL